MIHGPTINLIVKPQDMLLLYYGSQQVLPGPAASVKPGNVTVLQIIESKTLGLEYNILCFSKASK